MREQDPAQWPQAARQALAQTAFDLGPQGDMLDSCRRYAERLLSLPAEQVLDLAGVLLPPLEAEDWQQLLRQLRPDNRLLLQRLPRLLGGEFVRTHADSMAGTCTASLGGVDGQSDRARWALSWPAGRGAGRVALVFCCAGAAFAALCASGRCAAHAAGLVLARRYGQSERTTLAAGRLVVAGRSAGAMG
ncbi:hypothetical protein ULF88_25065 [Halopseudomonas pachastrellae]|nr:hypothetical protein [Halopseudomonas pachastrellae]